MALCLFASDLHGRLTGYRALLNLIQRDRPAAVFLGGDLLPSGMAAMMAVRFDFDDFVSDFLAAELAALKQTLGDAYPRVFVILGNDDGRIEEHLFLEGQALGLWEYIHNRRVEFGGFQVYGYAYVPPTPFLFKDWERYDISRFVDPGSVSPEEGTRTVPVPESETRYATIAADLARLAGEDEQQRAIWLFHAPPYQTKLDRVAVDGKMIDHVPLDPHVGSIAIRRFIESRQPLMTLHGHLHESTRLTGAWQDQIGRTICLNAAHDGPQLSLIRFDPEFPDRASRELL